MRVVQVHYYPLRAFPLVSLLHYYQGTIVGELAQAYCTTKCVCELGWGNLRLDGVK